MSETWVDRLLAEKDELQQRVLKLTDFLIDVPTDVDDDQIVLMGAQLALMTALRDILSQRIARLK